MSDNEPAASRSGTPPVTPVKKAKGKGRGKREASPDEYAPSDVAVGSEDEEPMTKQGSASKGGSKKASPAKKAKTAGVGSSGSSPSGRPVWTSEMKKKLFLSVVGHPTIGSCGEVATELEKTPTQCYDQWRQRLLPALLKKIDEM